MLSKMFPAPETILDHAVLDLEIPHSNRRACDGMEKTDVRVDGAMVA